MSSINIIFMDNGYLFVLASWPTAIGAAPYLKALSYTFKLWKFYDWVDISHYTKISTQNTSCSEYDIEYYIETESASW